MGLLDVTGVVVRWGQYLVPGIYLYPKPNGHKRVVPELQAQLHPSLSTTTQSRGIPAVNADWRLEQCRDVMHALEHSECREVSHPCYPTHPTRLYRQGLDRCEEAGGRDGCIEGCTVPILSVGHRFHTERTSLVSMAMGHERHSRSGRSNWATMPSTGTVCSPLHWHSWILGSASAYAQGTVAAVPHQ